MNLTKVSDVKFFTPTGTTVDASCLTAQPVRMGVLNRPVNLDFSNNYEWSKAVYDSLDQSHPEAAEMEPAKIKI